LGGQPLGELAAAVERVVRVGAVERVRLDDAALARVRLLAGRPQVDHRLAAEDAELERKSTRLNSSHVSISYAVFCLKKKKELLFADGVNFSGCSVLVRHSMIGPRCARGPCQTSSMLSPAASSISLFTRSPSVSISAT